MRVEKPLRLDLRGRQHHNGGAEAARFLHIPQGSSAPCTWGQERPGSSIPPFKVCCLRTLVFDCAWLLLLPCGWAKSPRRVVSRRQRYFLHPAKSAVGPAATTCNAPGICGSMWNMCICANGSERALARKVERHYVAVPGQVATDGIVPVAGVGLII